MGFKLQKNTFKQFFTTSALSSEVFDKSLELFLQQLSGSAGVLAGDGRFSVLLHTLISQNYPQLPGRVCFLGARKPGALEALQSK